MDSAPSLPGGTVTFLFTDIEGSTRHSEQHPEAMEAALARHDALAAEIIRQHQGTVVKHRGEGDSLFSVFARAIDAVAAATELQRSLTTESWPEGAVLRVRIALHTGDATLRDGDYFGTAVNRCARLRSTAHGEQVLLSQTTCELVQDHLPPGVALRDLGHHRLRDLQRPEHVFQLLHPQLPADFPPLRSLDARTNNLPAQPTPLVGREQEVVQVRDLLRQEHVRLLTLTGPGGTGKTRLGLQVAAEMLDDFPDGAYFVELAPIRDPGLVPSTVAQALGVREEGRPVREDLEEYLRQKQLLLVLDNFEHLLEAAPLLAGWTREAPRLKVLVTSRAVLNLRGEQELPVPPLAVPDPAQTATAATLSPYAAVDLLVQRARNVRPYFVLTEENAPAVAEICRRLDGLPLAIELAAARLRLFSPQALLARLENRLQVLTGGARDVPARQQTLRDAIAWSYDLLSDQEQRLFRWLSVFVGGFSLEAAEGVCAGAGRDEECAALPASLSLLQPEEVLEGVASLVDKSLLRREEGCEGEPRFGLLETLREYGQECLVAHREDAALRRRHAAFFTWWAEHGGVLLEGYRLQPLQHPLPHENTWPWPLQSSGGALFREKAALLDRLEREHDNLRAALNWWIEAGEAAWGVRLADALYPLWRLRGYAIEGRERLGQLLALESLLERSLGRARALGYLGWLAWQRQREREKGQDTALMRAAFEEVLSIGRELQDKASIAGALGALGLVAEDRTSRGALLEEGLALCRELGDKQGIAEILHGLACLGFWDTGDFETAGALGEESVAINRELGSEHLAWSLIAAGNRACFGQENDVSARVLYEEALAVSRELGYHQGLRNSRFFLARATLAQGEYAEARALCEEHLSFEQALARQGQIAVALAHLAHVERCQGYYVEARQHYEACLSMLQDSGRLTGGPTVGVLTDLAFVAAELGDTRRAEALLRESLPRVSFPAAVAAGLTGFAVLARGRQQPERAARLLGAASALLASLPAHLRNRAVKLADRLDYERAVAATRAVLDEARFERAWSGGQSMTREQAIEYALEEPEAEAPAP